MKNKIRKAIGQISCGILATLFLVSMVVLFIDIYMTSIKLGIVMSVVAFITGLAIWGTTTDIKET